MIATIAQRLHERGRRHRRTHACRQPPARSRSGRRRSFQSLLASLAQQRGDTLIEVIVGALLLTVIVTGVLYGLNNANQATTIDRERSQANALAQQEEDQLRSEPIALLSELSNTNKVIEHEVNAKGTTYLISSSARYVADATATSSCSSTSPEASYIQTRSKVTWTALGEGKPVVETSIVSPPPGSALIVQITNQAAEPLQHAIVTATGQSSGATNAAAETSTDGCAILAVRPGSYTVNASKTGYVTRAGYSNVDEESASPIYVVAENTEKLSYQLGEAATINVEYENPPTKAKVSGEGFVIANEEMSPSFRAFPNSINAGTTTTTTGPSVFPFETRAYEVYAGSCEADNPHTLDAAVEQHYLTKPGQIIAATVQEPPVAIDVLSGTGSKSKGSPVPLAAVTLTDSCGVTHRTQTNSSGELSYPAPYGTYTLCVTGGASGVAANRKYTTASFTNNTPTGPSAITALSNAGEASNKAAVIYLGSGAPTTPGKLESGGTCP